MRSYVGMVCLGQWGVVVLLVSDKRPLTYDGIRPILIFNVTNNVEQPIFDRSQDCSALRFIGPYLQRSKQHRAGSRHIKDVIIT